MNRARYSKKYNVFIAKPDEDIQISTHDIMVSSRKIAGYAVFGIVFGWLNNSNPMYKLKQDTLNEKMGI